MDKRAAILDRLFDVLNAIPPQLGYDEHSAFRDRGGLKTDKRPAIVLLDGHEEAAGALPERRGRMFMAAQVMTLLPQIFFVPDERPMSEQSGIENEITTFRNAVISAVANDKELAMLCGPNGGVVLRRIETDMRTGMTLQGQIAFYFAFNYVLDPYGLPAVSTT